MNNEEQEITREGLKIVALRERVAQLTAEYEDKIADLRVELTYNAAELQHLKDKYEPETDEEKG